MDARQNVLRMLRRQGPESVPFEFNLCQAQQEAMEQATGGVPYPEFFQFQVRTVAARRPQPGDFSAYYRARSALAAYADEWGIAYEPGRVVSLTLAQQPGVGMTLFAFDAGEGVSTHAAPGDAMVYVLEGEAQITIDGAPHSVTGGSAIILPAGIPHAVAAVTPFKMLLTVVKES